MFRFDVEKYRYDAMKYKIINNYKNNNRSLLKAVFSSSVNKPNLNLFMSNLEQSDGFKAHRWVVERTHSWLNRYSRLLIRCEKKIENDEAMLHFACGLIVWNKSVLG